MATTLFRQTWWVSVAVVLALLQIVFAVGIALDSEATTTDRLVIGLVWGASAGIALTGAARRPHSRRMGDALIGLGVLPTAMGGVIFFWFPPMWLTTAAGLVVIASAIRDARSPAGAATA